MKTIGLLGGMSWESTAGYYREINEGVKHCNCRYRHYRCFLPLSGGTQC